MYDQTQGSGAVFFLYSIISTQFRTVTRRVRSEVKFHLMCHSHTYIHTYIQQVPSHLPNKSCIHETRVQSKEFKEYI